MPSAVSRKILAHNAGRDPVRVAMKFAHLRHDPFGFFRGTNHLFVELLPRRHALWRAPAAFVCGDLHLENFGSFKGDNRLCYFDINDFDAACLAPLSIDLVRFAASVHMAARTLGWKPALRDAMIRSFLDAYAAAIIDGKARWLERSLAEGPVRTLLKRATDRTRSELLDRFTAGRSHRRFTVDGRRLLKASPQAASPIRRMLAGLEIHHAVAGVNQQFLKLLDVANRVAGCDSLGGERFALLVEGRGSPQGNFILDLKVADYSVTARWCGRRQPDFGTEAGRVVRVQRLMQAISPALLSPARLGGGSYILKELQPALDRVDLAALGAKPKRLKRLAANMGAVTAWAHLRSANHLGAASIEDLQGFARTRGWVTGVEALARRTARGLLQAYARYCKDYDAGAIVY